MRQACVAFTPAKALLSVKDVILQYKVPEQVVTATYEVLFDVCHSDHFLILSPPPAVESLHFSKEFWDYVTPTQGQICPKGETIQRPGSDRVMVFQGFDQLLPWKTVLENVTFALTNGKGLAAAQARSVAGGYIEMVGLADFRDSYPHMLSGGMKQRVAIARGMAMEPEILLMDEPFAALDALTRARMQEELLALWEDKKFTILFVTHSINEAIRIGSRILLLSAHPGQVMAELSNADCTDRYASADLEKRINKILFNK